MIGDVFKLKGPIRGYFLNEIDLKDEIFRSVMRILELLYAENIPHNLFFTYDSIGCRQVVSVFIFPRHQMVEIKELTGYNVACCELAGYIQAGSEWFFILY